MSLRSGTTSRHALALLLAGHRHAFLVSASALSELLEAFADAVASDADAFGPRRAGRTPERREARADGVAVGRVVVAVDVVCLGVPHIGGRGGADVDEFPREIGDQVDPTTPTDHAARLRP